MKESVKESIRIVTAQSGRSFRVWKIMGWLSLSLINMNIADFKGRGKYRWGFISLFSGPFTTIYLTFTKSYAEHPDAIIPRSAAELYNVEDQPLKVTLPVQSNIKQKNPPKLNIDQDNK